MEKIIYPVWKSDLESSEAFKARLLGEAAKELLERGAHRLRIHVVDEAVEPANPTRMVNTRPPVSGMISIWLPTAFRRAPLEEVIEGATSRMAGYLVTESEAIQNTEFVAPDGERTPGYAQIVFLQIPPRLRRDAWLKHWIDEHTTVGIETQSNFRYVQNIVARELTYAAPQYRAIVEECFPSEAMSDRTVFYDAVGNPERFRLHEDRMMESCARFIDFDRIDCIPMSEYVIRS